MSRRHGLRLARLLLVPLLGVALVLLFPPTSGNPHGMVGQSELGATCHNTEATETIRPVLEGLPAQYRAGASYVLTVRVEGGKDPTVPEGHDGGFNLHATVGELDAIDDLVLISSQRELLHDMTGSGHENVPFPKDTWGEATFTHLGAEQREWQVEWDAPRLEGSGQATFHLAVLAANGDHKATPEDEWNTAVFVVDEGEPLPFILRFKYEVGFAVLLLLGTAGFLVIRQRRRAHDPTVKKEKRAARATGGFTECPDCGQSLRQGHLKEHRRRVHHKWM